MRDKVNDLVLRGPVMRNPGNIARVEVPFVDSWAEVAYDSESLKNLPMAQKHITRLVTRDIFIYTPGRTGFARVSSVPV